MFYAEYITNGTAHRSPVVPTFKEAAKFAQAAIAKGCGGKSGVAIRRVKEEVAAPEGFAPTPAPVVAAAKPARKAKGGAA